MAAVPSCFDGCANFIPVPEDKTDAVHATGPNSATTAAHQEAATAEGADAGEMVRRMPLADEHTEETADIAPLPVQHGLASRMESQAGRTAANELAAVVEDGGYAPMGGRAGVDSGRYMKNSTRHVPAR